MPVKKKSKPTGKTSKTSADDRYPPVKGFRLSLKALERLARHAEKESERLGIPVSQTKALERLLLRILTENGDVQVIESDFPPK